MEPLNPALASALESMSDLLFVHRFGGGPRTAAKYGDPNVVREHVCNLLTAYSEMTTAIDKDGGRYKEMVWPVKTRYVKMHP